VSSTFRSLAVRNYRYYAGGQVVSNTGTWLQRVAQDWLVLKLTGSGTALGVTTALQFLPMLFSPWGGVLADRYTKRHVLMVTQSIMGLLALMLGVLNLTNVVNVYHVYALALLLGMVTAVDNPTRQAFVVEMVGPDDLPNAVSLNSANFNLGRILGPAVGGVLISWVGTGWVFVTNAASFVAVLAGLFMIRPAELHHVPRVKREPGQLREGLRYIRSRPDLSILLFVVFFVGTFGMNFQITLALVSKDVFHEGSSGFGLLSSLMAVGSLTGSLLAARRAMPRMRVVLGAGVVFGILEAITGVMPSFALLAAVLIPTGVFALTFNTTANSGMQNGVEPTIRGRVMGIYMLVFVGGTPVGAPIIGWVGSQWGPRWTLIIGGIVSALAAVVGVWALARVTGLRVHVHLGLPPKLSLVRARGAGVPATTGAAAIPAVAESVATCAPAAASSVASTSSTSQADVLVADGALSRGETAVLDAAIKNVTRSDDANSDMPVRGAGHTPAAGAGRFGHGPVSLEGRRARAHGMAARRRVKHGDERLDEPPADSVVG
jgi:MFS family permease